MSFALTTQQIIDETKTVTRRLGWPNLKSYELVEAVEKGMGLKKGEKIVRLKALEIQSNRPESLDLMLKNEAYGLQEVILEGFPHLTPSEFVEMFCKHNKCKPDRIINRIAFRYPTYTFGGYV